MSLQEQVDLPTKTVLIIALSRPDNFILPLEQAPKWYGISPDSTRAGLRQLQVRDLLGADYLIPHRTWATRTAAESSGSST